jgi:hypothetical protein
MNYVKLTHPSINSGTAVTVLCDQINIGGKKNISNNAYVGGTVQSEIHTQAFENLGIQMQGIHFTGQTNTLTYPMLLTLYRAKYDGLADTTCTLNVVYGSGTQTTLVGVDGSTTNIKVVMESFNFPISTKDSKGAYMPVGSINWVETA